MNIPELMNYLAYGNINSKLYLAYSEVARELILKAADEIRQQTLGDNFSNDTIANKGSVEMLHGNIKGLLP